MFVKKFDPVKYTAVLKFWMGSAMKSSSPIFKMCSTFCIGFVYNLILRFIVCMCVGPGWKKRWYMNW